jgi:flagellar hook-associated protein 2
MASINFTGLITGIDTDKILEGLLAIQKRRVETLSARKDEVTIRQAALNEVANRLRALQDSLFSLARSQNSVFDGRKVQVNFPDLVTATATSQAAPGVYSFQVLSTARPHQIASQGYDSPDSLITTGTLQIQVGNSNPVSITIDSTNNTLQGLANAINAANANVTATVIHDGSSTQPYRLLLSAKNAGAANTIRITNNLGSDTGSTTKPVFDSTYIGNAFAATSNTGTSVASTNRGAGAYTGSVSKSYTLTVISGGTVGSDTITVHYEDSTGTQAGTLTLNPGDAGVYKTVAEGVQVSFSAGTLNSGDKFTIDVFAPEIQTPTSAAIRIGSGPGALTIQSDSNRFTDLFPGVTVVVQGADTNRTVQLTIANDTEKIREAINQFVQKYNDLMTYLNQQTAYNAKTQQAGPLFANRTVTQIQDELRRLVTDVIPGLPSRMNRLSAAGISITDQGTLTLSTSRLDSVLSGEIPGVSIEDVKRLFAFTGQSSNEGIRFLVGSTQTDGSGIPIRVDITQAAQQASLLATSALASTTAIDNSNNQLTVRVDGQLYDISLTPGNYTRQQLAEELQSRINSLAAQNGRQVTVTVEGDRLRIRSQSYGVRSEIEMAGGSALGTLGFTSGQRALGQDVAGEFIVNGQRESARGFGQLLIGDDQNRYTSGLQVRVTLSSSQLVTGAEGELIVTRGVAARLDRYISQVLDAQAGVLASGKQALDTEAQRLQDSIDRLNQLINEQRDSLQKKFRALENMVSQLRGIGDMLSMQFQALANTNSPFNRR